MKIIAAVAVAVALSATGAGAQQAMLAAPGMPLVQQPAPFMQLPPGPLVQLPMPHMQQPPMQQQGMPMIQQPMPSGPAGEPVIRVANTFRTAVPASETESMSDAKAQETIRRSLYGMVAGECAVLSEAFKADCRLNSFTVQALPAAAPGTLTATAIYELKPKAN